MAARNSWAVSTAGGILTTEDVRLHVGALVTPGSTNVKSRTGLRPGGSTAAASPGLVAAQSSPDKTVKINPFQMFLQTGRGAGTYIQCLDVATNLDLLTAHPADGSLQRNDLIIAQQNDTTYGDGNNTWSVIQVVGTPSGSPADPTVTGSTDFVKLARVRVTAAASTITSGMIDDLRPPWAVALGGTLPINNATDRATLTPHEGMQIWRIDRGWTESYSIAAGGWLVDGPAVCTSTADRDAIITTPYNGQLAITTDTGLTWVRRSGAWVSSPNRPRVQMSATAAQPSPLATATFTPIVFNAEDYDNFNGHDLVTNPTRYTCQVAGWYTLSGGIGYAVSGTGSRGAIWQKNGSFIANSQCMYASSGSLVSTIISAKTVDVQLAVGDYVELCGYQNSGGTLALTASGAGGSDNAYANIKWMSE